MADKSTVKKHNISSEARAKATQTRQLRAVFNKYLASLTGRRVQSTHSKIAEIDAFLKEGSKQRRVPKFTNGKRVGTEMKDVALLPADRARLIARRRELERKIPVTGKENLRDHFLKILPEYASSQGWDRSILLEAGVSAIDLDEVGIK
jgi:hypothetical protein